MNTYTIGYLFTYNLGVKPEDRNWHETSYTLEAESYDDALVRSDEQFRSYHHNLECVHSADLTNLI